MNDRLCVASGGKEQRELSPQFPLSCFASGNGCDGGDVAETMNEAQLKGVPLGGILKVGLYKLDSPVHDEFASVQVEFALNH
jgi:hypothetical protein